MPIVICFDGIHEFRKNGVTAIPADIPAVVLIKLLLFVVFIMIGSKKRDSI
jgi:hypothetical protein